MMNTLTITFEQDIINRCREMGVLLVEELTEQYNVYSNARKKHTTPANWVTDWVRGRESKEIWLSRNFLEYVTFVEDLLERLKKEDGDLRNLCECLDNQKLQPVARLYLNLTIAQYINAIEILARKAHAQWSCGASELRILEYLRQGVHCGFFLIYTRFVKDIVWELKNREKRILKVLAK